MAGVGDRVVASLLSALAEAPDVAAATSKLLIQIAEHTGAKRACMLRLDVAQETLEVVSTVGLGADLAPAGFAVGDASNALVISALSLTPLVGEGALGPGTFASIGTWMTLPMSQPQFPGSLEVLSPQRVAELAAALPVRMLEPVEQRPGMAPVGVILIEGPVADAVFAEALDIAILASPIIARLEALERAHARSDALAQQRERLKLMVDSLPDPVVITNASNEIIANNHRAARLLRNRDDDSPGRRRALELNNLLFTSFLSKAAMLGTRQSGPRELNLVDPDEGNDLLFE